MSLKSFSINMQVIKSYIFFRLKDTFRNSVFSIVNAFAFVCKFGLIKQDRLYRVYTSREGAGAGRESPWNGGIYSSVTGGGHV